MLLLFVYILFALGTSFICSVLEAVLLSVSVYQLMPLAEAGNTGARKMIELKRDRADDAITSILVLNTIAHTIGATLAGAQAAEVFGSQWVGVFSGVLTLLILVGTEIIPKTAGHTYALQLSGIAASTITWMIRLLTPIVAASRLLTRLISGHSEEGRVSRQQLSAIIAAARQQGVLDRGEWKQLANMLTLEEVQVADTMTPRTVVFMLPASTTVGELTRHEAANSFSRIPIFDKNIDDVIGYIFVREVFHAVATGLSVETPLREVMREVTFVSGKVSVREVLEQLLERREPMAIVHDEFGGTAGLVSMEDLLETILGEEIHDEEGFNALDLRELATTRRNARLKALRENGRVIEKTEDEDEAADAPAPEEAAAAPEEAAAALEDKAAAPEKREEVVEQTPSEE